MEAEIGRHAGRAQSAEIGCQEAIVCNGLELVTQDDRVVLPTQHAGDLVARLEPRVLRIDYLADAATPHHFADLGGRDIAADILHPPFLGGVEAQHEIFDQHLALAGHDDRCLDPFEVVVRELPPERPAIDEPLPIDRRHEFLPRRLKRRRTGVAQRPAAARRRILCGLACKGLDVFAGERSF